MDNRQNEPEKKTSVFGGKTPILRLCFTTMFYDYGLPWDRRSPSPWAKKRPKIGQKSPGFQKSGSFWASGTGTGGRVSYTPEA